MFALNDRLPNTSLMAVIVAIAASCLFILSSTPADASSDSNSGFNDDGTVVLRVARTKLVGGSRCVNNLVGSFGLEQFTRIALASEIDSSSEAAGGMKAMSLVIRGLGVRHYYDPWNNLAYCFNVSPFQYHVHDRRVAFSPLKSSLYDPGNSNNKPNDRVTDTMGKYMQPRKNGQDVDVYFNDCMHNKMNALAASFTDPQTIVTQAFQNPGTCADGQINPDGTNDEPCYPPGDPNGCKYTEWRTPTYELHQNLKSMTNRVAAATPPYSSHNISSFGFDQARQAEAFWGNDMPFGQIGPHGQPGTYIISTGHATISEYLVYYSSGTSATLYVNGISDRPQPVVASVYVDGYYCCYLDWNENDNKRHLDSVSLPYKGSGFHTLAIQFREATYGSSADTSRWLYLDDLAVISPVED